MFRANKDNALFLTFPVRHNMPAEPLIFKRLITNLRGHGAFDILA